MKSEMELPRCNHPERMFSGDSRGWVPGIFFLADFMHFFRQRSIRFLVIDPIFESYLGRLIVLVQQFKTNLQRIPDFHFRAWNLEILHTDIADSRVEAKQLHHLRIALF